MLTLLKKGFLVLRLNWRHLGTLYYQSLQLLFRIKNFFLKVKCLETGEKMDFSSPSPAGEKKSIFSPVPAKQTIKNSQDYF